MQSIYRAIAVEQSVITQVALLALFCQNQVKFKIKWELPLYFISADRVIFEFPTLVWQGEVYSFTHMANAPAGFEEQAPYTIALVKLNEGPVVTAQLTDLGNEQVRIGMPVEMVTRKIRNDGDDRGMIVYGYKFRPAFSR